MNYIKKNKYIIGKFLIWIAFLVAFILGALRIIPINYGWIYIVVLTGINVFWTKKMKKIEILSKEKMK